MIEVAIASMQRGARRNGETAPEGSLDPAGADARRRQRWPRTSRRRRGTRRQRQVAAEPRRPRPGPASRCSRGARRDRVDEPRGAPRRDRAAPDGRSRRNGRDPEVASDPDRSRAARPGAGATRAHRRATTADCGRPAPSLAAAREERDDPRHDPEIREMARDDRGASWRRDEAALVERIRRAAAAHATRTTTAT